MDRGDVSGVLEWLPRRAQRRIVASLVVVVTAASYLAPGLHMRERVIRWVLAAYTEQVEDRFNDILPALMPSARPARPADSNE